MTDTRRSFNAELSHVNGHANGRYRLRKYQYCGWIPRAFTVDTDDGNWHGRLSKPQRHPVTNCNAILIG
jgi:hypothetical protein